MFKRNSPDAKDRAQLSDGSPPCRTPTLAIEESTSVSIADLARSHVKIVFRFGPFKLCAAERLLKRDDEALPIGGRALDLLAVLVERAGEIISHKELIARAWPDVRVGESNVRVHIAALRKVLGDGLNGARYISNVAGRGYCFVATVFRSVAERTLPEASQAVGPKGEITATFGRAEADLEWLRAVFEGSQSEQHTILLNLFAGALTQELLKAGQFDKALSTVNAAMNHATRFGMTFHTPELLRLKAEVLAATAEKNSTSALNYLEEALKAARGHSAPARWASNEYGKRLRHSRAKGLKTSP
jgi:DNA-binding winged helix-turn-helix (wHTH) protein